MSRSTVHIAAKLLNHSPAASGSRDLCSLVFLTQNFYFLVIIGYAEIQDYWSTEYHQVAYGICLHDSTVPMLCAIGVWRITIHLCCPQNGKVRISCKINFCAFLIGSLNTKITWGIAVTSLHLIL